MPTLRCSATGDSLTIIQDSQTIHAARAFLPEARGGNLSDVSSHRQGLNDMADFLKADGVSADGRHEPVAGWLWWALNPNSNDTGGLVWDGASPPPISAS